MQLYLKNINAGPIAVVSFAMNLMDVVEYAIVSLEESVKITRHVAIQIAKVLHAVQMDADVLVQIRYIHTKRKMCIEQSMCFQWNLSSWTMSKYDRYMYGC